MTYNVFGGTLNLALSINYCFSPPVTTYYFTQANLSSYDFPSV